MLANAKCKHPVARLFTRLRVYVAIAECTTRQRGYVLTGCSYLRQLTGRGDDVSDGLCATQATSGRAGLCLHDLSDYNSRRGSSRTMHHASRIMLRHTARSNFKTLL